MDYPLGGDCSAPGILASDFERLEAACASLHGDAPLYQQVVSRLRALFEVLESCGTRDRAFVASGLDSTVRDLLRALELQSRNAFPLHWVAASQRSVAQVCQVHRRIDTLYDTLGVSEASLLTDWHDIFRDNRLEHERWLVERLELSTDAMIFSDVPSETKRREALATLQNQLKVWTTSGVSDDQETTSTKLKMSRKLAGLMLQTADRILSYTKTHEEEVYEWYVPEEDVEISKTPFKEDMYSGLHKGTWFDHRTCEQRDIVIKQLGFDPTNALGNSITFSRELTLWSQMKHKHVLELLGGNHLSRPKFFITEYATEGSFDDFFERRGDNRKLLWRLFVQVAEGLRFLHSHNTEHGRLKCSNILLTRPEGGTDEDIVAKLSSFSTAIKRTENSDDSGRIDSIALHYAAPEHLQKTGGAVDFRSADVYSLGLCVVEAATGEPPFNMMGDDEVIELKLSSEPIGRPYESFTDDEWALVASMCENDPSKRPTLDQVIERMRELDKRCHG